MESRSYNFSTGTKRSTLLDTKPIYFARDEEGSPRHHILSHECPEDFGAFLTCMKDNNNKLALCQDQKSVLDECAVLAFKKCNTEMGFKYE